MLLDVAAGRERVDGKHAFAYRKKIMCRISM